MLLPSSEDALEQAEFCCVPQNTATSSLEASSFLLSGALLAAGSDGSAGAGDCEGVESQQQRYAGQEHLHASVKVARENT